MGISNKGPSFAAAPLPPPSALEDEVAMCVAASTALYNLAIDTPVQEAVASSNRLAHMLAGLKHGDARVVARLAGE